MLAVLALLPLLTGCERAFFSARGRVGSDGGRFGQWSTTPEGCSRDPLDGKPVIASFFWEDSVDTGETVGGPRRDQFPDAPLELDLFEENGQTTARLQTVLVPATPLDRSNCSVLQVNTSEQKAAYRNGRPTLRGALRLDCQAGGSHVTADLKFSRCEY